MFKTYSLPTEVYNTTYVQFHLEKTYFAVNLAQHAQLDLSESELLQCKGHQDFEIYPADKSVLSNEIKTCLLSLFYSWETPTKPANDGCT